MISVTHSRLVELAHSRRARFLFEMEGIFVAKNSKSSHRNARSKPSAHGSHPIHIEALESRLMLTAAVSGVVHPLLIAGNLPPTTQLSLITPTNVVTTTAATQTYGTVITLTATVTGTPGTAPTGTVTFSNGTTVIGTGTSVTTDDDTGVSTWTLEISVKQPVRVYHSMPIGQLIYFEISGEIGTPYDTKASAKYTQRTDKPVESMMWKNFDKK